MRKGFLGFLLGAAVGAVNIALIINDMEYVVAAVDLLATILARRNDRDSFRR